MTDAQINETLARESGFTDFEIKPWGALFARYPEDNIKRAVPDFLNDFNACLKWAKPSLMQDHLNGIHIYYDHHEKKTYCYLILDTKEYSASVNGVENKESRAFCLAYLKSLEDKK